MPEAETTKVAKKIEEPVKKESGSDVSDAVHKEVNQVLTANPQVANDMTQLRQVSAQLEQSGVLGKLAVDDTSIQALSKGGKEITRESLSATLNDRNSSPENRLLAVALLDRFSDIHKGGTGGISLQELQNWARGSESAGVNDRPTTLAAPDGSTTKFTYDQTTGDNANMPTRIEVPGNPPRVYERAKDASTGQYTDGYKDQDGKPIARIDVERDGTFTVQYENGNSVHHHRDNSEVTTDKSGKVTDVRYANGDSEQFSYDSSNPPRINKITETRGGETRTLVPSLGADQPYAWRIGDANGNNLRMAQPGEMLSKPVVDPDGTFRWTSGDGRTVTRTTDNQTLTASAAPSDRPGVARDATGRITSETAPDGSRISYKYPDGDTNRHTPPDSITVTNKQGVVVEAFARDPNDGTYTHQKYTPLPPGVAGPPAPEKTEKVTEFKINEGTGGYSYKLENGTVVDKTSTQTVVSPPGLDQQALQVSAQQLHQAIEKKDKDAVHRILEPMTADDRRALETVYHDLYDKNGPEGTLRRDIQQQFDPIEAARDIAILDRRGGATNDAGELDVQLTQLAKGDKNATVAIREILATLNPEQIKQLDSDLRTRYGDKYPNGLQSAIDENKNISDEEKRVLKILQKGITNTPDGSPGRTVQDNVNLANMALQMKPPDLTLLGEALRGNEPSAKNAREQLQRDTAFLQKVSDKFGANNPIARDFINQGYISLETIADANNEGYFGNNRKNVELALQNATLEERQRYVRGQELAASGANPAPDSQDAKDLRFYQLTHDALVSLSRGQNPVTPDVVDPPKADPGLFLRDRLGVSQSDLDHYRDDPSSRAALDDKVKKLQGTDKFLAQDLLQKLATGGDITQLSPVDQLLLDANRNASGQRTLLDAEKVFSDPQMRERLLALYSKDDKGYLAAGGTPETKERDKALLDIVRRASGLNSDNTREFYTPEAQLITLLAEGHFSAGDLASLGFPDSVIQQRLQGESGKERERSQQQIDRIYGDGKNTAKDVTKWEDQLIRGGSIISTLADHHDNQNDVLQTIEHMSRQDWGRLNNPELREAFIRDVNKALQTYGVDEQTRKKAEELLRAKGQASDWTAAQEVRRSILDAGSDSKVLIDNLTHLSKAEQDKYLNNTDGFRDKVNELLNKSKLDDNEKLFARRYLDQLQRDGKLPTLETMSPLDRVLYDNATGADPTRLMDDLEVVLRDPELRKQLSKDQILHAGELASASYTRHADVEPAENRALAEIIRKATGGIIDNAAKYASTAASAQYMMQPTLDQLLKNGKLDLNTKISLHYPTERLYSDIAQLPEKDRQKYIDQLRLTDDQKKILDNVIQAPQNGQMRLEDRLRAFIINDRVPYDSDTRDKSKYSDFQASLAAMSPAELQHLKSEYARKYGGDFDNDFLKKVDKKDYDLYKQLLTPERGDGRQEYYDALGKLKRSETGYIPEGPDLNAQRALQLYATALGDAQSGFKSLSPEDQAQFQKYFGEALQQLLDAQKEFAEKLISMGEKAVLFGAGILAIAASGGTLSPAVMAAIVAAGGAIDGATRVAVLQQVQGANFDGSVGNVLSEFSRGFAQGAFDTVGMVTLPGAIKGAAEVAATVSGKLAATFNTALDASKGGWKTFESKLNDLIVRKGTNAVTEADIQEITRPLLAQGVDEQQAQRLAREALAETQARAGQQAAEVFGYNLSRTAQDAPIINSIRRAKDLNTLRAILTEAGEQGAENPAVRAAVRDAVIKQLDDTRIPFSEISAFINKDPAMKPFQFIKTEEPDEIFVNALKRRADYEIDHRPDVFVSNKEEIDSIRREIQNGVPERDLAQRIVNAINPNLTPEEKAAALARLTQENKAIVDPWLQHIDQVYGTQSKSNQKLFERILQKADRPSILADKPWFNVEHIRDSFRFKTVLDDITDLPKILADAKAQGFEIIKPDTDKVLNPKEWGWRIAAFDMRMPNGQIVEYYLPVKELEEVKGANHLLFEKWRNIDVKTLTGDALKEYQADLRLSNERYQTAWEAYLKRTGQTEEDVRRALEEVQALFQPPK